MYSDCFYICFYSFVLNALVNAAFCCLCVLLIYFPMSRPLFVYVYFCVTNKIDFISFELLMDTVFILVVFC